MADDDHEAVRRYQEGRAQRDAEAYREQRLSQGWVGASLPPRIRRRPVRIIARVLGRRRRG